MSRIESIKVKCPECGKKFKSDFWASVNIGINPELKERVLSGKINTKTCPKCGSFVKIEHPILYHDMDNKIWLWIHWLTKEDMSKIPEEDKENVRKIMKAKYESEIDNRISYILEDYKKDVVFNKDDLNKKIKELEHQSMVLKVCK